MEPIPETAEVIDQIEPSLPGSQERLAQLRDAAERVRAVAPECVGMSLALLKHGVTLTLVATGDEIAALDGVQYISDGPCVRAVDEDRTVAYRAGEVLDETSWLLFARATADAGIASTLTLPIVKDQQVVGSVNLYGRTSDAFTGRHEPIAAILGAWAPGAVTNADLAFSTRHTAEEAPLALREEMRIQLAIGIIVASEGLDPDTARAGLREAAERAGTSESSLAKAIIGRLGSGGEPPGR